MIRATTTPPTIHQTRRFFFFFCTCSSVTGSACTSGSMTPMTASVALCSSCMALRSACILAAASLAKLMDQMNDEQHQQRRKSGQHDPHPPDGERGQHRKLYGLPGSLKGQIAADLGRLHLLPNAVFVFHIEIQLSALPIGRAEADRMRVCAVIRRRSCHCSTTERATCAAGAMAVRNVFAIFPNCLRDAG